MTKTPPPALWLLIFIIGLPRLSETVYSPALPNIAHDLSVTQAWVAYTLTIYLLGFAFGTAIWGNISDQYGRKPCLLLGLAIYIVGCISCFMAHSLSMLMLSRFIQALGGSAGTVLGLAMCRDAFQGQARGKAFSSIAIAIGVARAIGPFIGGLLTQYLGWSTIFIFLTTAGCFAFLLCQQQLVETHPVISPSAPKLYSLARQMLRDRKLMTFALLIAASHGIVCSFYAEGPFLLIEQLKLSPSQFGMSYLMMAAGNIGGAYLSKRLQAFYSSLLILKYGINIIVGMSLIFVIAIWFAQVFHIADQYYITIILISMLGIMLGFGLTIPNALSLALEHYQRAIGAASSLLGLFYYLLIALFTLGMGWLHNASLMTMPLYFLSIASLMRVAFLMNLAPKATALNTLS
jgi:Bcr/CflA subfamily drug resistance transporter